MEWIIMHYILKKWRRKYKYRGMFETQKVSRRDNFRKEWSKHLNKYKSQMGQDQVSGGVSVRCWLASSVACFMETSEIWKQGQIRL